MPVGPAAKKAGKAAPNAPVVQPRVEAPAPVADLPPSSSAVNAGSVRTVLLMGETGSGKSTFINYLANFFLGGGLRALKVVIPNKVYTEVTESDFATHSEANVHDSTVSQTKRCTIYAFRRESAVYRFIDTPGLSDTSNSAERCVDDENVNTILSAAGQAGELQAIVLIINGSTSRMTVNLRNALQRIAGNYPDILLSNMLAIFTNTSSGAMNFEKASLVNTPKKSFIMNNSAFSSLSSQWDDDEQILQETFWRQSMKKMSEIIGFIDQLAPQSTRVFRDMLASRQEIKSQIFLASTEIAKQQVFIEALEKLKREEAEIQTRMKRDQTEAELQERDAEYFRSREKVNKATRAKVEGDEKDIQDQRCRAESSAAMVASQLETSREQLEEAKRSELPSSYYVEYEEVKYKKIRKTPDYHNTICRTCNVTCHEGCILTFTNVAGDEIFEHCACMNSDRTCNRCNRCAPSTHLHEKYVIEEITQNIEKINEAKKDEYMRKLREVRSLEFSITNLAEQAESAQEEIKRCDALLANVSKQTSGIRIDEGQIRKQKEEALKKKKSAEGSLKLANQKKTVIQTQLSETENKLQEAAQALKEAQRVVEVKCRELKAICSKFNFVEELQLTKDSLRTSLASLRSSDAWEKAQAFIKTLDQLADGLTG